MAIDEKCAVVDNDVINHVTDIDGSKEEIADIARNVFLAMEVVAIVHPLVYEHEVRKDHEKTAWLFSDGVIGTPSLEDVFQQDPAQRQYYDLLLRDLYHMWKGRAFGDAFPTAEDVFSFWKRQESLGELHSMVMCYLCGCGMFLSDDSDSKALRKTMEMNGLEPVTVYSRKEFVEMLPQGAVPRNKRRAFAHEL